MGIIIFIVAYFFLCFLLFFFGSNMVVGFKKLLGKLGLASVVYTKDIGDGQIRVRIVRKDPFGGYFVHGISSYSCIKLYTNRRGSSYVKEWTPYAAKRDFEKWLKA